MSMTLDELEAAALRLSTNEREWLAERLLTSLEEDELRRRIERLEADPASAIPGEQVMAHVREITVQQTPAVSGQQVRPDMDGDRPTTGRWTRSKRPITRLAERVEDALDNREADQRLRARHNRSPSPWEQVKDRLGL